MLLQSWALTASRPEDEHEMPAKERLTLRRGLSAYDFVSRPYLAMYVINSNSYAIWSPSICGEDWVVSVAAASDLYAAGPCMIDFTTCFLCNLLQFLFKSWTPHTEFQASEP